MGNNKAPAPPNISVVLRVLGGGYLVYLAWQLFRDAQGEIKYILAAAVFGVVGLVLAVWSGWSLITNEYFRDKPSQENTQEQNPEQ